MSEGFEKIDSNISNEDSNETPESEFAKMSEDNRRELMDLGKETGRPEALVEEQYNRLTGLVKSVIDSESGDLNAKSKKAIETAIDKVGGLSRDTELHERFKREVLSSTQNLSSQDEEAIMHELSIETQKAFYRTMTHQEYEDWAMEGAGSTRINDVLYYNKSEDGVGIHLAESRFKEKGETMKLIEEGLRDLAPVIKEDEDVKTVTATSWIVGHRSGKKLMKRMGFTIDGPISEEEKQKDFQYETRPVWTSHIDRGDFLRKYGEDI